MRNHHVFQEICRFDKLQISQSIETGQVYAGEFVGSAAITVINTSSGIRNHSSRSIMTGNQDGIIFVVSADADMQGDKKEQEPVPSEVTSQLHSIMDTGEVLPARDHHRWSVCQDGHQARQIWYGDSILGQPTRHSFLDT